ncbi:CinA family protein [Pseudomonas vranovensis]|uniref:CinA family protein n=1 Tax=Pseudomonas vranovensis TaxID=321661 RepID=UPI000F4A3283
MDQLKEHLQGICDYLQAHGLMLTTAESCTAGCIVALLSQIPGSGCVLESGYVVYSPEAKQRLLNVSADTIDRFGLTSEAVARCDARLKRHRIFSSALPGA